MGEKLIHSDLRGRARSHSDGNDLEMKGKERLGVVVSLKFSETIKKPHFRPPPCTELSAILSKSEVQQVKLASRAGSQMKALLARITLVFPASLRLHLGRRNSASKFQASKTPENSSFSDHVSLNRSFLASKWRKFNSESGRKCARLQAIHP